MAENRNAPGDAGSSDSDGSAGTGAGAGAGAAGAAAGAGAAAATAPPRRTPTHITPYALANSFTPTKQLTFWAQATKVPSSWTPVPVNPENRHLFVDVFKDFLDTFAISAFRVPTEGDGTIHPAVRTIAGRDYPNYDLSKYVDVLDDHNPRLKNQELLKYSSWIFGDDGQLFDVRAPTDMISKAIDPDLPGNIGLVNQEKLKLRRESVMAFQFLRALLTPQDFKPFRLKQKTYAYTVQESETTIVNCGLVLWSHVVEKLFPDVKVSTEALEKKMKNLTLADCENNLVTYFTEIEDLRQQIEADKKTPYDLDTYVTLIFSRLEVYKQEDFLSDVRAEKRLWNKGKSTAADIISSLSITYNNLVEEKKWTKLDSSAEQVIALSTELKDVKKQLAAKKAGGGGGGNSGGDASKTYAPSWQVTYTKKTIEHPKEKYEMVWCSKHTSKDGKVKGMYMRAPHDHDKWVEEKKKRKSAWQEKLAAKKAEKSSSSKPDRKKSAGKGSDKTSSKKLKLSKSLQSAFCTQFHCTPADLDKVMASAHAATDGSSDSDASSTSSSSDSEHSN